MSNLLEAVQNRPIPPNLPIAQCEPELLWHPQIPKPMAGMAPRQLMGDAWWTAERKKALAEANGHCRACGVHVLRAWPESRLEVHERYSFRGKTLTYKGAVALCPACHAYIHTGFLLRRLTCGEVSRELYNAIIKHGDQVSRHASSCSERTWRDKPDDSSTKWWRGWKLVVGDQVFRSKLTSESAWRNAMHERNSNE